MLCKLNKKQKIFLTSLIFILVLTINPLVVADDEVENGDDFAKDLGIIAIGFFVVSVVNVGILYFYRFSRKFFTEDSGSNRIKETTRNFYLKTRKPLNFVHYFIGLAAVTVLVIHGVKLTQKENETVVLGWITAGVYVFYILTGLILKLKLKPIWNSKKIVRILNKIHRSMIVFIGIIITHIVHVLIAD
ncbi:MAG: hypothetical protein ACFFDS_08475 [Candidatus Thorarchaeota archaeon]